MSSPRDWNYYQREYIENERSPGDIAREHGTYTNKIIREIKKLGFALRDHSAAQSIALKNGRHAHPTRGRKRSEDVCLKISETMADNWASIDTEERERRSDTARQAWNEMTAEQKEFFKSRAAEALRTSAKDGSILEKYLQKHLREAGYTLQYHCKHVLGGNKFHLDLLIPELKTAIEIDGPSHSLPLWGEDNLKRVQAADQHKNNVLLLYGYTVIRLQHLAKNLSDSLKRKYLKVLLAKLTEIKQNKLKGVIILGVEDE